jgi:hypothetical protein
MEENSKILTFQKEISLIQSKEKQEFVREALALLPDYFFTIPASSTGKYHPSYALGEGGLVRHTKAAVIIFYDIANLEMFHVTPEERDLGIVALILHDGLKNGIEQNTYTLTKHPVINEVCSYIETHMGQWNTDYKTQEEVLEKPSTKMQKLVHLADYLASRKYLELNFNTGY